MCSLIRLTHPQLLLWTDTPRKLNDLANAVLLDLDRKASAELKSWGHAEGHSAFNFSKVGSRRGASPATAAAHKETFCLCISETKSLLSHKRANQAKKERERERLSLCPHSLSLSLFASLPLVHCLV